MAECETDKDSFWICSGDRAWENGYLIPPQRMSELANKISMFDDLKRERDEYRDLLDEMKRSRDQFMTITSELRELLKLSSSLVEDYKEQRDRFHQELLLMEKDYRDRSIEYERCLRNSNGMWSGWEVGTLSAGVGILSIFAGAGLYAIIR